MRNIWSILKLLLPGFYFGEFIVPGPPSYESSRNFLQSAGQGNIVAQVNDQVKVAYYICALTFCQFISSCLFSHISNLLCTFSIVFNNTAFSSEFDCF